MPPHCVHAGPRSRPSIRAGTTGGRSVNATVGACVPPLPPPFPPFVGPSIVLAGTAGIYVDRASTAPWTRPSSEFVAPYGMFTAAEFALVARRHMHMYGTKPDALATVAAVIRNNGHVHPDAVYSGRGPFTPQDILDSRRGTSADPKTDALLRFARTVVAKQGLVDDADVAAVRDVGHGDAEIAEVVAHVALNIFTNYFNNVAGTPIDAACQAASLPASPPPMMWTIGQIVLGGRGDVLGTTPSPILPTARNRRPHSRKQADGQPAS